MAIVSFSFALVFTLGVGLSSAGCDKQEAPTHRDSKFYFAEDAPIGAHIMLGEHDVGSVRGPASYVNHGDEPQYRFVYGRVPVSYSSSDDARLEAEMRTPCGIRREVIASREVEGRGAPVFSIVASGDEQASSTIIWSVLPTESDVRLGEVKLNGDLHSQTVNGLNCAPKHIISVGGKAIGELEMTPGAEMGVFVAKDVDTCYKVSVANFSSSNFGSGGIRINYLKGQAAYPFPHTRLDYKFKPMPTSLSVSKGTDFSRKVGVEKVDCADIPPSR